MEEFHHHGSDLMNQDTGSNPALQRYDPREWSGRLTDKPTSGSSAGSLQFTVKESSEALETVKFPMT